MKYLVQSREDGLERTPIYYMFFIFKNLRLCAIFLKIISVEKVIHLISSKHISYIHCFDTVLYKYFLVSSHLDLLSRSWTSIYSIFSYLHFSNEEKESQCGEMISDTTLWLIDTLIQ